MTDTLAASGGIGLAAPQINERVQVALVHIPGGPHRYGDLETVPLTVYVNPVIRVLDDSRQGYWEGCLSVPGQFAEIDRPDKCHIKYLDYNGRTKELKAQGLLATCIQHEIDHLKGILFIEYLSKLKRDIILKKLSKHKLEQKRLVI